MGRKTSEEKRMLRVTHTPAINTTMPTFWFPHGWHVIYIKYKSKMKMKIIQ